MHKVHSPQQNLQRFLEIAMNASFHQLLQTLQRLGHRIMCGLSHARLSSHRAQHLH
jgi:hypothetical protein